MTMHALDMLYKDVILDHHKEPRNFGRVEGAQLTREGLNPLCGDHVTVSVKLDPKGERIDRCGFEGQGCSICLASASIMTEEVSGGTVKDARRKVREFRELMLGKRPPEAFEGDVEALAGVRKFPVRIKCALLGWTTLNDALERHALGVDVTKGVSRTECPEEVS